MEKIKLRRKIMGILIFGVSILIGLIIVIIIGGIITQNFVYTPQFKDDNGKIVPGSIAGFKRIELCGNSQAVLIRGKNIDNPIVLFLHAGPGLSETGMMRNMNAVLENYYTMVYLDQRGGGKSYSFFNDPEKYTTDQLLQDIHELTQYLKKTLNKEKIILMGHCFGAGFAEYAAVRYPEDYSMIIAITQPTIPCEMDRLSYPWIIEQAEKEGNEKALKELESVNEFWNLKDQKGYINGMMINKKWIGYYGGMVSGRKDFLSYIFENSFCNEYNIFDIFPYMAGLSAVGHSSYEIMITTDLVKQASEFKCSFILIEGRRDYNVVPALSEAYYNIVKAPYKKIYWFENSAHFPHFEEKENFQKIMIEEIIPLVKGN